MCWIKSVETETECPLRPSSVFLVGKRLLPPNLLRVSCETPNNDAQSHIRIPGNHPGRQIGKMLHALRQQFRLDVTGPWNIGENLRFCRPGNPIPPADLGLRCPRLITLRHIVLHRVNSRILAPTFAYACTLLLAFIGSESNEVKACLPAGARKKSLTGPSSVGAKSKSDDYIRTRKATNPHLLTAVGISKSVGMLFPVSGTD
jgi:hypothetical protein